MNEDNQKIAIAEARGWTKIIKLDYSPYRTSPYPDGPEECWVGENPETGSVKPLPNYPSDLNAMHEAEETLTEHEWNQMFEWLLHIRWRDANATERHGIGKQKALSPARASAAQRAEAFLRVKNKWEK